jgi:hypothetical protein
MTSENPLGQLTSFLVFDGWTNVAVLLFSVATLPLLYWWVRRDAGWRIAGGLFCATNIGGLASPSAIYLSPSTVYGAWGMSSATLASLGFAFAGGAYVVLSALPNIRRFQLRYGMMLIWIFGWTLFAAGIAANAVNTSSTVGAVHATSFMIGLVIGVSAFWGQGSPRTVSPDRSRDTQVRIEAG